jgi:hypothetical protein
MKNLSGFTWHIPEGTVQLGRLHHWQRRVVRSTQSRNRRNVCETNKQDGMQLYQVNDMTFKAKTPLRNDFSLLMTVTESTLKKEHHRVIVEEGEMVKINDWEVVYLDEERG